MQPLVDLRAEPVRFAGPRSAGAAGKREDLLCEPRGFVAGKSVAVGVHVIGIGQFVLSRGDERLHATLRRDDQVVGHRRVRVAAGVAQRGGLFCGRRSFLEFLELVVRFTQARPGTRIFRLHVRGDLELAQRVLKERLNRRAPRVGQREVCFRRDDEGALRRITFAEDAVGDGQRAVGVFCAQKSAGFIEIRAQCVFRIGRREARSCGRLVWVVGVGARTRAGRNRHRAQRGCNPQG